MSSDRPEPFRVAPAGILLFVRLTPRASADKVGGVETAADGRVHVTVKVRAVPEKGAANASLEKLVASWLRVPRSAVSVIAGETSRLKTLRIVGHVPALVESVRLKLQCST